MFGLLEVMYEEMAKELDREPEVDWDSLPDEEHPAYCPEFWKE